MRKWRNCTFLSSLETRADVRAQVKALDFNRNHGPIESGRDLLQGTFSFSGTCHELLDSHLYWYGQQRSRVFLALCRESCPDDNQY